MLLFIFNTEINSQDYNAKTLTTDNGLPSDQIYCSTEDSKGFIWIGTKNGVARWDSKNFEYFTIKDGLSNNEVTGIYEDSKGRIWFISFNKELSYYFRGKIINQTNDIRLKKIELAPSSSFIELNKYIYYKGKEENTLFYFHIDSLKPFLLDSQLWEDLGIIDDKIILLTDDKYNFYKSKHSEKIDNEKIIKFYLNNGILLSKQTNSIKDSILKITNIKYKFNNNKIQIDNFILKEQNNKLTVIKNNLSLFFKNNVISKINIDNIKKLYSLKNQIYYITSDFKIIDINRIKEIKQLKSINTIYNIYNDKSKTILTTNTSIIDLSDNFKKLNIGKIKEKFFGLQKTDKLSYKTTFYLANKKIFYFGCMQGVLIKKKDSFSYIYRKNRVYSIFINSQKILWYSTLDNLYYTIQYDDSISNINQLILNPKFKVFVNEIKEDKRGNMIFATNNGVYIYNPSTKVKYWLHDANLLTSNECNRIEIDPKDNSLWISTFNGLNHIKYSQTNGKLHFNAINRFFTDDGLNANEINDFLIQGDSVWVATPKGLNLIHDKNNRPDSLNIPIYINKLWVNDLPKSLVSELKFNSDENNLTIDFSAIYYQRRDRLEVYYKLIRSGDTTVKYIKDNKLNLLALRDGDYQFQLYAYDQDYPYIHSELKTIQFSIQPPFYKAWWFWAGILFAISGVIAYLYYKKLIRAKNRELEIANTQSKLNEYSLKSLQNQMNPHFIFNSLNTIQHYITTQNEDEATAYLSQFSKLMREMLENTKTNTIALDKELEFNQRYVDLELMRYNHKFDVHFDINIEEDLSEIFIPNMLIQPLIENAIKHGVANLEGRKGLIKIKIQLISEDRLEIQIIDNGQGKNNKKMSSHASTATNVIYQRLELYTKNNTKGSFNITFSYNGTIAILILPI